MAIFDPEFGEIQLRQSDSARGIKFSIGVNGLPKISAPTRHSERKILNFVEEYRAEIRQILRERSGQKLYHDGEQIGQKHWLIFRQRVEFGKKNTKTSPIKIKIEGSQIIVTAADFNLFSTQTEIRKAVLKILKKEAREYLSRRTEILAANHNFHFEKLKFTHSKTRWGSCSSRGTISLNIALMNLPLPLIDYVIIHELCHLRQMNHSPEFWREVEKYCPEYRARVAEIKQFSPQI